MTFLSILLVVAVLVALVFFLVRKSKNNELPNFQYNPVTSEDDFTSKVEEVQSEVPVSASSILADVDALEDVKVDVSSETSSSSKDEYVAAKELKTEASQPVGAAPTPQKPKRTKKKTTATKKVAKKN